jgi:hypothetical protein
MAARFRQKSRVPAAFPALSGLACLKPLNLHGRDEIRQAALIQINYVRYRTFAGIIKDRELFRFECVRRFKCVGLCRTIKGFVPRTKTANGIRG